MEVVNVFTLVDSPCDPIYSFIRIDIRNIRSAPLKVFQELKPYVLIFLSRRVSIRVERGEKAVKGLLSEDPFSLGRGLGETHSLNTFRKRQRLKVKLLAQRTLS